MASSGKPYPVRTPRPEGCARSRHLAGLTLVETLATFVILGLLTTLVIQAVGFFAARYDGIQRVHRATTLASLGQNWFATTVQGLVPVGVHARRFVGGRAAFEGTTLQPLNAEPGTPVIARWSIGEGTPRGGGRIGEESNAASKPGSGENPSARSGSGVRYAELPAPGATGIEWTVHVADDPREADAAWSFEYRDALGNWHDQWPPPKADAGGPALDYLLDPAEDWTPRLIRLVSASEGTVWLARVDPAPRPLVTEDDLR